MHADALHAGVYFQMHTRLCFHCGGRLINLPQLVDGGGRHHQAMRDELRDLPRGHTAKDENRQRDARLPQHDGLFQQGHAQAGRAMVHQVLCYLDDAMAIGIRLHHRHD